MTLVTTDLTVNLYAVETVKMARHVIQAQATVRPDANQDIPDISV